MHLNQILVIEREVLDRYPGMKYVLIELAEQMFEGPTEYTYLPRPETMEAFLRILEAQKIPFYFPKVFSW